MRVRLTICQPAPDTCPPEFMAMSLGAPSRPNMTLHIAPNCRAAQPRDHKPEIVEGNTQIAGGQASLPAPSIGADLDLILLTHRSIASSLTLHDDFYIIIIILFRFSSQLQMMFSHGKMSTRTPHSRVSVCLI